MKKKTKTLIIVMLIVIVFNITLRIFIDTRPKLAVIENAWDSEVYEYLRDSDIKTDKTYAELKGECEDLLDQHFYIYIGKDHRLRNDTADGYCLMLFRTVVVNENMPKHNYVYTLVHELIHLKYFNRNETWVNFETFKVLYESGNEFFVNSAKRVASVYLKNGCNEKEYDISGQVIEYLKGERYENNYRNIF